MLGSLLYLGLITGGLVAAFAAIDLLCRWFSGQLEMERSARRRARPPTEPPHRPIEQVAADLHRLSGQLARVPAGAPQARRSGLQAAYDDVLIEAALLLEVPHSLTGLPPGNARAAERRRMEISLAAAGLRPIF
ncbi:hypothetical protein [Petropleomorpha daqingensis]|uniref:Uncharacterized protein n=1 Tax=Petropleomorpha daqingensis TaxID=2026353 RepID=A0A853CMK7_9ACTN|nr:hypothetical protein [Petropleomorpha daqingensis]NYJ07752.1 hypothetical protein [Petropleomorpha daqingensis]